MSSGINTVRVFSITNHQSRFLPSSTLHLRNNSLCGFGIGVEKKNKQCSVVAASVGGSKVGHFENTLPYKGYYYYLCIYVFYMYAQYIFYVICLMFWWNLLCDVRGS